VSTRPTPNDGEFSSLQPSAATAAAAAAALETVFCPPNLPGPNGEFAGTEQPGLVRPWETSFGGGGGGGLDNFDVEREALGGGGGGHCLLEVDVASIVFDHHHLFSLEHYWTSRLRCSYSVYRQALARRSRLDLDRRLRLLNEATDEVKEKLEICVQAAERDFQVCIY